VFQNVSVRPHQVNYRFFIRSLQIFDAFYKASFMRNYLTLLYDDDQLKYLLMHCTNVRVTSVVSSYTERVSRTTDRTARLRLMKPCAT